MISRAFKWCIGYRGNAVQNLEVPVDDSEGQTPDMNVGVESDTGKLLKYKGLLKRTFRL